MIVENCTIVRAARDRATNAIDVYVLVRFRLDTRARQFTKIQLIRVRRTEVGSLRELRTIVLNRAITACAEEFGPSMARFRKARRQ